MLRQKTLFPCTLSRATALSLTEKINCELRKKRNPLTMLLAARSKLSRS